MKTNQKQQIKKAILALSAGIGFSLASSLAYAATLQVDANDGSCSDVTGVPYCTIQAAITAAADNDTIEIASGIYVENLTINDKSLSFIGEDRASTIIDGNDAGSVFTSTNAATKNYNFSKLTLRNGKGINGGGISVVQGDVTLTDSSVINNEATAAGGGAAVINGALSLTGSSISNNKAMSVSVGGFLVVNGNFSMTDSSVNQNLSKTMGGGLVSTGSATITNSTISQNKATATSVGALGVINGSITIDNSHIDENLANTDIGGLLHTGSGDILIKNSTMNGNESITASGGAMYNTQGHLTIENSQVSNNTAGTSAAGIYHVDPAGNMIIKSSTFNNNVASGPIGAILSSGPLTIENSVIAGNQAAMGAGVAGTSDITIRKTSLSFNQASIGDAGALYHVGVGHVIIDESSFNQNYATGNVGALLSSGGTLDITNSTFSDNEANALAGAVFNGSTAKIVNTTFSGNQAGTHGAGLYNLGTATVRNVTFSENRSDSNNDGAGVGGGFANAGTLNLKNSISAGNIGGPSGDPDCFGPVNSEGYNLIETVTVNCPIAGVLTGNQTGIDPLLNTLGNNGGPTLTHALADGSPAIDAADPAGCVDGDGNPLTDDQRGAPRPQGSACDLGAVESGCGDGVVHTGEECDDANTDDTDSCTSICKNAICGDGILAATEACDDSNTDSGDGCSASCIDETVPVCGDNIKQTGEECDDGNTDDLDGCSSVCASEIAAASSAGSGSSGGGCSINSNPDTQVSMYGLMMIFSVGLLSLLKRFKTVR